MPAASEKPDEDEGIAWSSRTGGVRLVPTAPIAATATAAQANLALARLVNILSPPDATPTPSVTTSAAIAAVAPPHSRTGRKRRGPVGPPPRTLAPSSFCCQGAHDSKSSTSLTVQGGRSSRADGQPQAFSNARGAEHAEISYQRCRHARGATAGISAAVERLGRQLAFARDTCPLPIQWQAGHHLRHRSPLSALGG